MDFQQFNNLYNLPEKEFWAKFASVEATDKDFAIFESVAIARRQAENS